MQCSVNLRNFHVTYNSLAAWIATKILHNKIICYKTSHKNTLHSNTTATRTIKHYAHEMWKTSQFKLWDIIFHINRFFFFSKYLRLFHEIISVDLNSLHSFFFSFIPHMQVCVKKAKAAMMNRRPEQIWTVSFVGFLF